MSYLGLAQLAAFRQQRDAAHDHSRSAVAALHRPGFEKRFLQRVEASVIFQAFNRRDALPGGLGNRRNARSHSFAIQQNSAGAALPFSTTVLRARQIQVVAQNAEQASLRAGVQAACGPIYIQFSHARHNTIMCKLSRDGTERFFGNAGMVFFVRELSRSNPLMRSRLFTLGALVLFLAVDVSLFAQYPPGGYPPGGYPPGSYPPGQSPGGIGGIPMPRRKKKTAKEDDQAVLQNMKGMLRKLDDKAVVIEPEDT